MAITTGITNASMERVAAAPFSPVVTIGFAVPAVPALEPSRSIPIAVCIKPAAPPPAIRPRPHLSGVAISSLIYEVLMSVPAPTEKEILGNLYGYLQNRTAIIITHRIFSLFQFDKIIVMENGKIAETGNHKELMNLNGIYAEMYRNQQVKEDEKPANNVENLS